MQEDGEGVVYADENLYDDHGPEELAPSACLLDAQEHEGEGDFDGGHGPCPEGLGDCGVFEGCLGVGEEEGGGGKAEGVGDG